MDEIKRERGRPKKYFFHRLENLNFKVRGDLYDKIQVECKKVIDRITEENPEEIPNKIVYYVVKGLTSTEKDIILFSAFNNHIYSNISHKKSLKLRIIYLMTKCLDEGGSPIQVYEKTVQKIETKKNITDINTCCNAILSSRLGRKYLKDLFTRRKNLGLNDPNKKIVIDTNSDFYKSCEYLLNLSTWEDFCLALKRYKYRGIQK